VLEPAWEQESPRRTCQGVGAGVRRDSAQVKHAPTCAHAHAHNASKHRLARVRMRRRAPRTHEFTRLRVPMCARSPPPPLAVHAIPPSTRAAESRAVCGLPPLQTEPAGAEQTAITRGRPDAPRPGRGPRQQSWNGRLPCAPRAGSTRTAGCLSYPARPDPGHPAWPGPAQVTVMHGEQVGRMAAEAVMGRAGCNFAGRAG
jgi:hypothetical protein